MTKLAIAIIAFTLTATGTMVGLDAAEESGTYAELPGVKLWFADTGGTGAPLVLLHANTGTSAVWQSQVSAFSRAGYRVIAFDRRGWGKSMADPPTGPQPATIASDLDALAEHLNLDRFHLLGVAGGGFGGPVGVAHTGALLALSPMLLVALT